MRIDLHTHSNRSDGTDPVAVLLAHAQESGLDVIALTDHDTADGWTEGRMAAEELGIGFVPGIEISCKLNGVSVHLLSYLLDPSYPALAEELRIVRDGRTDRIPSIVARLNSVGVPLTVPDRRHPPAQPPGGEPGHRRERGAVQPRDGAQQRIFHLARGRRLQLA